MSQPSLYFDHAAAAPLDTDVLTAMMPYMTQQFYNPSAGYTAAEDVRQVVNRARSAIAQCLGARQTEIYFTAGGTEANNIAIHGVMQQYPSGRIAVTSVEHDSVLEPARQYQHTIIPVLPDGRVDITQITHLITDEHVVISIQYANNETGVVQPLRQITQIVDQIRQDRFDRGVDMPLYVHTDACQAPAYLDIHIARLGVDMLTLNAGKIYGPKQVGALYVKAACRLAPYIRGGGQERGLRSGTENVAGIIGLQYALQSVTAGRSQEADRLRRLQQQWIRQISQTIPRAQLTGSQKYRLPNNIHITIPGEDNERLLVLLDAAGVLCAAGSACSAGSQLPSHVLQAMGISQDVARSSLRFTMGRSTTIEHIEYAQSVLADLVRPER